MRVAVVLDRFVPRCLGVPVLEWLDGAVGFERVLTIVGTPTRRAHPSTACVLYVRWERRRDGGHGDVGRDLGSLLDGHQVVELRDGRLDPRAARAIDEVTPDIVLDLRLLSDAPVLEITGRELWRVELRDDAGAPVRTLAGLFATFASGSQTCDITLVARGAHNGGEALIARATVGVPSASFNRNLDLCGSKAAAVIRRELERRRTAPGDARPHDAPDEARAVAAETRGGVVALARFARRRVTARRVVRQTLAATQWVVGVRPRLKGRPFDDLSGYQPILADTPTSRADPFVVSDAGRTYVFFEEFGAGLEKGRISVAELDEAGNASASVPVLELPYHLSYPFVFRHDDEYFMIPETGQANRVELYRASEFPYRWVRERVLLDDIIAVDATILSHADRLWLFALFSDGPDRLNDELYLFSAGTLDDTWVPHPRNPVVSDPRCARPAGNVLHIDGALVRPAQDCLVRYGRAVVMRRIVTLDEREYREETVSVLEPTWMPGLEGTHTYNRDARFEVIDGCRRVP
jgi:hypothetical protein